MLIRKQIQDRMSDTVFFFFFFFGGGGGGLILYKNKNKITHWSVMIYFWLLVIAFMCEDTNFL